MKSSPLGLETCFSKLIYLTMPGERGFREPGQLSNLPGYFAADRRRAGEAVATNFDLYLRSANDIVLERDGPWWNVEHTLAVLALMTMFSVAFSIWVYVLRRRLQGQKWMIRLQLAQESGPARTCRGSEPRQERVSGQHEP